MKIFKKVKKGFTLVELVVVIAVIAILSAVSVGAYFGITDSANNSKLEQEAKQIHTAIQAVALSPDSSASISRDGLIIDDIDEFRLAIENNIGHDINIGDTENSYVDNCPTIYFSTSEYSASSGNDTVYQTYQYINNTIANKKAIADVVTGEVKVVSVTTNVTPGTSEDDSSTGTTPDATTIAPTPSEDSTQDITTIDPTETSTESTSVETPKTQSLILSHNLTTTGNMSGNNDANTYFGLDASKWEIKSIKGKPTNHIGLNKDGYMALYYHSSLEGSTLSISYEKKIMSIYIDTANYAVPTFTVNGVNSVQKTEIEINANTVEIQNINSTNTQLKIKSITIVYEE